MPHLGVSSAVIVEVKVPRPHVRLGPKLAREIAALALREIPFRNCSDAVQRIAKMP